VYKEEEEEEMFLLRFLFRPIDDTAWNRGRRKRSQKGKDPGKEKTRVGGRTWREEAKDLAMVYAPVQSVGLSISPADGACRRSPILLLLLPASAASPFCCCC
jgi:hypothetical protein